MCRQTIVVYSIYYIDLGPAINNTIDNIINKRVYGLNSFLTYILITHGYSNQTILIQT